MEKRFFYAKVPPLRCGLDLANRWKYEIPAYRVAPHVWNVGGQDDVSVYLLDTGDGLVLIDTGYEATLYMTIDRIHRIGFDPRDIRAILLSHWHSDHVGGVPFLKAMSGAEVWISKEDEAEHQRNKNVTFPRAIPQYTVDHFYDNSKPLIFGRFEIRTRLCPGHTPGCTTFRFTDTDDATGEAFICAMHGGMGVPSMKPEKLRESGLPFEMAYRFVDDCLELAQWKVDICLPSHLNQANVMDSFPPDPDDYRWFIAGYAWGDILKNRAEAVKAWFPEKYGQTP